MYLHNNRLLVSKVELECGILHTHIIEVHRCGGEHIKDVRFVTSQLLGHVEGVRELVVAALRRRLLDAVQQLYLSITRPPLTIFVCIATSAYVITASFCMLTCIYNREC